MTVRDPITKKLIPGPFIKKTDGGPGILSKEAESIDFSENCAAEGAQIILSLPNGKECTAELDQMYSTFKPATKKSTKRVAATKMVACVEAKKNAYVHQKQSRKSFVYDLNVYLDEQEVSAGNFDDDLQDKN